jgi:hypothetical protein
MDKETPSDSKERKPGFYRRLFYMAVPVREHAFALSVIKDRLHGLRGHWRALTHERDLSSPNAPDMNNFRAVLQLWGINSREELQAVKGGLLCEVALSGTVLPGLAGLLLYQGRTITGIFLLLLTPFVTLPRVWRFRVLHTRKFTPFLRWLCAPWR